MRCSLAFLIGALILSLAASPAQAQRAIGYSDATVVIPDPTSNCAIGTRTINHDGSFENGYGWDGGGTVPPYYGAFAESYDLGTGTVSCAAFWLTQNGFFNGHPLDAYVWDGGITGEPGGVLCLVPNVVPTNIPFWPECGQNDFQIGCPVTGEFTVGWWADFHDEYLQYYTCADLNGPGGCPWTCIAPGIGYPTGWHDPSVVWFDTCSLGIGVFFARDPSGIEEFPEEGPPPESPTWGQIKAIFGK